MARTHPETALSGESSGRVERCLANWKAFQELEVAAFHGGSNNRIFRLGRAGKTLLCAKVYRRDEHGTSPRFANEQLFYSFVHDAVAGYIPEALHWDQKEHVAIFEWIDGVSDNSIKQGDIEFAGQFIRSLQRVRRGPHLGPASDACWSETAHLASVERRIQRLESLATRGVLTREAVGVTMDRVLPSWNRLKQDLSPAATTEFSDLVLSPSDFGFHNALRVRDGKWCFLDFEYAGIDDPAKLLCDAVARPGQTLPEDALQKLCLYAGFSAEVESRALQFLNLHRLKWACILLWRLTPEGGERGAFAGCADDPATVLRTITTLLERGA